MEDSDATVAPDIEEPMSDGEKSPSFLNTLYAGNTCTGNTRTGVNTCPHSFSEQWYSVTVVEEEGLMSTANPCHQNYL